MMIEGAVIVAVGNTSHQSQLIYNRPRTMLPALGKPLVVRMMDRLARTGLSHFVVIVGEMEGEAAAHLSKHWLPNVSLEFVMKTNRDSLHDTFVDVAQRYAKPLLYTRYNAFTHPSLPASVLKKQQEMGEGLMLAGAPQTLSKQAHQGYTIARDGVHVSALLPPDNATTNDKRLLMSDLVVCGAHFMAFVAKQPKHSDPQRNKPIEALFAQYLAESGGSAGVVQTAWTLPIQHDADLLTMHRNLLDEGQDANILSELPDSVTIIPPVRIDPHVSVAPNAVIGPYVYLERGSSVGAGAVIKQALVLQNATIKPQEQISNQIMYSRGCIAYG
jgi:UDP-N-acetylglucosamine diphosphorylase / glucose-1-phosphate thymidylyltransferase / UDP-N-acetylgalactosamine diphosphorylase / glucosamine-1-phosphate N-acetyltransferase / galactosamine-1-phosphate N-acetyltransferase